MAKVDADAEGSVGVVSRVDAFTDDERRVLAEALERRARDRRRFERSAPYPEQSAVMVAHRAETQTLIRLLDEVQL